uniref:DUF4124 domain-containing protein n=1 Tax=Polynucleobacter necessarius subsp. necessarius (strain STIR1) TaxID=452638 RepID=B1XUB9_POLNS
MILKVLVSPAVWFAVYLCTGLTAWADVYKCPADNGTVTLSNVEKGGNCKKMVLPPPETKKSVSQNKDASKPVAPDTKPAEKPKGVYESAASERKRITQEEIDLKK